MQPRFLEESLEQSDPEIYGLIRQEENRQRCGLELIASENYTSRAVMEALGSVLTNKYSEGLPGNRYYGGNEIIDQIEAKCQERALAVFGLCPQEWGVNVQPHSGTIANFAAYTALLSPNDRMMGLDLPSGGHLSHGYQTRTRKISATSIYFQTMGYQVDPATGLIDYEGLAQMTKMFHPKLIVCGASAYPREWDYERLREIADECGAYLLADIAHISGLVAVQEAKSPFPKCDVVTTTTHKTLRGPRAGLIFYRKCLQGTKSDLETRVNRAVFPGCQGGPHNHTIAAIAVALNQATRPEFREYCRNTRICCQKLADCLKAYGYLIVTGGTDNHLILWDLRPTGTAGSEMEVLCDHAHITINKNTVHGDKSALSPGGIRLGTAALVSRGFVPQDMSKVAEFLHQAVQLAQSIQAQSDGRLLKDFVDRMKLCTELEILGQAVKDYSSRFPVPGAK